MTANSQQITQRISRADLLLLLRLMGKQPWLKNVEPALLDLLDFCENQNDVGLIVDLLSRTTSLTDSDYSNAIKFLGNHIENAWQLNPNTTWFVSSNSKENTDSSQEVLNRIKSYPWASADWKRDRFLTRYRDVESKLKCGDTVVIVDDFIGTGRSMTKTLQWFEASALKHQKSVSLKVAVVSGCKTGIDAIMNLNKDLIYHTVIEKAISDFYEGADLANAIARMTALEDKLALSISTQSFADYRFGYKSSEAMYYREGGNTPNNVFPIFWWKQVRRGPRLVVMNRT